MGRDDAVVFAYGPWLLADVFKATPQICEAGGCGVRVVNLPWLNRVNLRWLHEIGVHRAIVTLDNHDVNGGQCEMLAAASLGLGPVPHVVRLGVEELPEWGTNNEVLERHGLDVAAVERALVRAYRGAAVQGDRVPQ